ncbi:hypothetical protein G3I44_15030 [Halogeometricum borinquense]|uniref:Uncharacterized protein n=1 Tax=Halogeometricum borinquense TaxID=60847 RepID=A0A6C0ULN0_9EURY|nr:rod-determining factor RdfA [Halogeometricum borinquense]QIB75493.1 hypothetical protein G3I44_15030 [Halogeometricum borinquense]
MGKSSTSPSRRGGKGPKIERVAERYSITGLGDELVERWRGDQGEQESLRTLADDVNVRIIEAALRQAGEHPVDGEAENFYRLLTSDDVTAGNQTDARNTLASKNIDTERLEADFISYQSVYNYLKRHRNVERENDGSSTNGDGFRTVKKISNRLRSVTEDAVDRVAANEDVTVGSPEVSVDVRIVCTDCDVRLTPDEFVEGGCRCE